MIKDSGERTEFQSGAVRDMHEGKGRFDLLPMCVLLRLARHYENGCAKYGDRNWEKGIPCHSFADSAMRHLVKYMDGQTDEDHLIAAIWNLCGLAWTEEKHPEMMDIPARITAANRSKQSEEEKKQYKPKVVKGRVQNTGLPIDGCVMAFSIWDYDNYGSWHLYGWDDDVDEAVMLTMYRAEDIGTSLRSFAKKWKAGEYEPPASFCLNLDKLEVIEVLQEEEKP